MLLSRYADLLKNWLADERDHAHVSYPWKPLIDDETGIIVPPKFELGQWERQSLPLMVSFSYQELFREFRDYFVREQEDIGDDTLEQETTVLGTLINY